MVNGSASAAASETTPRTPVKPSRKVHCHGGDRVAPRQRWAEPARHIDRRKDPDEARNHHYGDDERHRDRQLMQQYRIGALDQDAQLHAGDEEDSPSSR